MFCNNKSGQVEYHDYCWEQTDKIGVIHSKEIVNMSNTGNIQLASELSVAVQTIKTAILQSQARAVKGVNQEQLALYYGVDRYISENTRNKKWGTGALKRISERLRLELPGLRGFSETNLKNMRTFYGAWNIIEANSSVATDELGSWRSDEPSVHLQMGKWILLVILLIWALNYQEELHMTISHELLHTILSL